MTEHRQVLPVLPADSVATRILTVLEPGEKVHWQGAMGRRRGTFLRSATPLFFLVLAAWLLVRNGILDTGLAAFADAPLPWLMGGLLVAGIVVLPWFSALTSWDYALTDRRIMVLRNGRVRQEATPKSMILVGVRPGRRVLWRNVDNLSTDYRHDRGGFWGQEDPDALAELIHRWQAQGDVRAAAGAEAYRAAAEAASAVELTDEIPRDPVPNAGITRMANRDLGFRLDAPSAWEKTVESRYDGPLRLFGITLLPRIIRPGTPVPHEEGRETGWNSLELRGGPSAGLNVMVQRGVAVRTLESVINDPWAKLLGVQPGRVEDTLDISGFKGFAVVRSLPNGGNLTGFGRVPVPVLTYQWWLAGHGLAFEIQGIAPIDSQILQETAEQIVNSLAPI